MENIPEILSGLQAKKNKNDSILNSLENITADDVRELDDKINWHSKVINYAIYVLVIWSGLLTSAVVASYSRLEDRITNESHILSQRFDEERRFETQRLDELAHKETTDSQRNLSRNTNKIPNRDKSDAH